MQAIVVHSYGVPANLTLETVEKPAPNDDELLIKVHAAGTNALDWRLIRASPFLIRFMFFGLRKPTFTTPGADVAGTGVPGGLQVRGLRVSDADDTASKATLQNT